MSRDAVPVGMECRYWWYARLEHRSLPGQSAAVSQSGLDLSQGLAIERPEAFVTGHRGNSQVVEKVGQTEFLTLQGVVKIVVPY